MAKFKRAKSSELFDYDFFTNPLGLDIYEARRVLSKVANERMRQLERRSSTITGERLTFGAYEGARGYLETVGRERFSEALQRKRSVEDVNKELRKLQRFLSAKSSTISGQRDIERKRVRAFVNKGVPEDIAKSKEFFEFLKSQEFGKRKGQYDSETLIEEYTRAVGEGKPVTEILKEFEAYRLGETSSFSELVKKLGAIKIKGGANTK